MRAARILVVDDEVPMLRSVVGILQDEHDVRGTASPQEACAIADAFDPDVAILDIRMPEMDGYALLNHLKRRDPRIQVILMTGSVYNVDQQLIRAIREEAFYFVNKPFDRGVLRALVQRCLELQSLADANRRHVEHLESQLEEARAFQQTMLPAESARIEGFELAAGYRPCSELAGDLYDYAAAGPRRVAVLVADVAGHGASAAMLTGIVKSAFHASQPDAYDPARVVERVAAGIAAFDADRFVTLLCARISADEDSLVYVNAGHDGGFLCGPGRELRPLESTGPLISPGLPGLTWERRRLSWSPDGRLLLYTDGVSEAAQDAEMFGVDRLASLVSPRPADDRLPEAIFAEIDRFTGGRPAKDDMTLLSVRVVPASV